MARGRSSGDGAKETISLLSLHLLWSSWHRGRKRNRAEAHLLVDDLNSIGEKETFHGNGGGYR